MPATKAKPVPKTAAKPAPRPAAKTAPKPVATKPDAAPPPAAKAKADKLVRDSFTMPKSDHQLLVALKQRSIQLAHPAKKSELVRAGIQLLSALGDKALLAALAKVPALKTGRPKG